MPLRPPRRFRARFVPVPAAGFDFAGGAKSPRVLLRRR
jgi:hypothetical protein